MVGRPGRSKGCPNCRQRHLKCDETRPQCLRCQRKGWQCPGYPESHSFIAQDPSTWSNAVSRLRNVPFRGNASTVVHQLLPMTKQPMTHFDDQICFSFLRHHFLADHRFAGDQWPILAALDAPGSVAYKCLRAFAVQFFGRRNRYDPAVAQGLRSYTETLAELNVALQQPTSATPGTTALAITISTMCEYLSGPTPVGWIKHMLGLAAFVQVHGRTFFQSQANTRLFESVRYSIVMAAVAARKATILASEDWKRVPWVTSGVVKDPIQHFIDLATELPGIHEDFRLFLEHETCQTSPEIYEALDKKLHWLHVRFQEWRCGFDLEVASRSGSPTLVAPSRPDINLEPFPFATFRTLQAFLTYNSASIVLLRIWRAVKLSAHLVRPRNPSHDSGYGDYLSSKAPPPRRPHHDPASPHWQYDTTRLGDEVESLSQAGEHAAVEICRVLLYYTNDKGVLDHNVRLTVPTRMAVLALQGRDSLRAAWLISMLSGFASERGWQIGAYAQKEIRWTFSA